MDSEFLLSLIENRIPYRRVIRRYLGLFLFVTLALSAAAESTESMTPGDRIVSLEAQVKDLTKRAGDLAQSEQEWNDLVQKGGFLLLTGAILFGAIAAIWARTTDHSAVTWFFYGLLLNVGVLIMIWAVRKEAQEHHQGKRGHRVIGYY